VKTLGGGMGLNRFNQGKKNFAGRLAETDFTERLPAKNPMPDFFRFKHLFCLGKFCAPYFS
jgi:hypothetical protein